MMSSSPPITPPQRAEPNIARSSLAFWHSLNNPETALRAAFKSVRASCFPDRAGAELKGLGGFGGGSSEVLRRQQVALVARTGRAATGGRR